MERRFGRFVWDADRESANIVKHGIDFMTAVDVFLDVKRKIIIDSKHSIVERRYYCIGKVKDRVITVRFTYRKRQVRIFGAGYWRKGSKIYEKE